MHGKKLSINKKLVGQAKYVLPFVKKDVRWKLDVIENLYPAHPSIFTAINECIAQGVHTYPYPDEKYQKLMQLIGNYCGVTKENITLTNGSDTAIEIILRAIIPPGAKVLLPIPTFPQVELFLNVLDCTVDRAAVSEGSDLMKLDYSSFDVTYIVTPNLPLGYQISASDIATLVEKYPNTWFIVDEAYFEFGGWDTSAPLVNKYPNLIVLRTMSKAFALAGLRIGYSLTHPETTTLISPLINDKSVNNIAIWAAVAALENVEHYVRNTADMEAQKAYLAVELYNIIDDNSPIYEYNVEGGAFFLLMCRDPAYVCKVFAEHGIMVRNKTADWKDAVRVALGPREVIDDVLRVCRFINVRKFVSDPNSTILFDLDLTLRDGSTLDAPLFPGAEIVQKVNSRIVTNNNCLPVEVSSYFAKNDILVPEENIVTSLYSAKEYLIQNKMTAYILGDPRILPFFVDSAGNALYCTDFSSPKIDCVFLAWINVSMYDIARICNHLSAGKPLIYTDPSNYCLIKSSSEFGVDASLNSDTRIPDMQAIINMICSADEKYKSLVTCVGKPNMVLPTNGVFVGDSDADYNQARNLNALYININPNGKNGYDFDRDCLEFKSIGDLSALI